MTRPTHVGIPWYRAEHYPQIRALMADGDRLPAVYGTWRVSAEQVAGEIERSGIAVRRVEIEPDAFLGWCALRGLVADGAARSRFAAEAVEDSPRDEDAS